MDVIRAPRGTRDVLGDESWKWAYVLNHARGVAEDFGYKEVHLPIFEHTELFCRGIGETTDVVEKEMYTFLDRGERSITLRPELTASMVRSYLEHEMRNGSQPVKLWGAGPMFRYERPQKGRYRQFWQLDVEAIGSQSAMCDLEVIDFSMELYRRLGLTNLEVLVNSVGCPNCRPVYRKALQSFLGEKLGGLCETCNHRFDRNPLRILDCKKQECKELTENAPAVTDSLCGECREHFDLVWGGLAKIGASVRLDKRLVRGLDYYTKTAFEILAGELGSQNAVCGGGRYDNLAEAIGGPHVPAVGFASGIERIIMTMEGQGLTFGREPKICAFVVCADDASRMEGILLLHELRRGGIAADVDYGDKSMKAQMKQASQQDARYACIIGSSEVEGGTVTLKDLSTGEQETIARPALLDRIRERGADGGRMSEK